MTIANVITPMAELNLKSGGPGGSRTPDLLNAMPNLGRPDVSARVVVVFQLDSGICPKVRQSLQRIPG